MKPRSTFTKTDLVVVLCCAVFLLGSLGAVGSGGRKRAKEAVCLSNLRQWGVIFSMWANDHGGYLVGGLLQGTQDPDEVEYWLNALRPYYSSQPKLLLCPMAKKPMFDEAGNRTGAQHPYASWGIVSEGQWPWCRAGDDGSYGINDWTNNPPPGANPLGGLEWQWRTPNVKGAAEIPVLLDCLWMGGRPLHNNTAPTYSGQFGASNDRMKSFCIDRHDGSSNGLFLDFSVRAIPLKCYWHLRWHRAFDITAGPTVWPDWMSEFPLCGY